MVGGDAETGGVDGGTLSPAPRFEMPRNALARSIHRFAMMGEFTGG